MIGIRGSDRKLGSKGVQVIHPGEVLVLRTPGGGGLVQPRRAMPHPCVTVPTTNWPEDSRRR